MGAHYEFESFTEAFAQMRIWEEQANAKVTKEQRTITWGSHFLHPHPRLGLLIFGHTQTEDQLVADERSCGADEEEAEATLRTIRNSHERGYRFGRHYSTVEPEGELGSTHISRCWPLTAEQFRQAQELGWDGKSILAKHDWLADVLIDFNDAIGR